MGEAPAGAPSSPTSVDLRAILHRASRFGEQLWNVRYIQLAATFNPSFDAAPTLISTEIQYTCLVTE